MTDKENLSKKKTSADWLLRGVLTKIGDTFDRLTGRRWIASSSLATSELADRIKKLLDSEAKIIPGKGVVVPHNIKLKMQWDKFSTDSDTLIKKLENELLVAAIDHINDSLYYTYEPVALVVKPDYFIEGVKLFVGFEKFDEEDREVEMNVTIPAINVSGLIPPIQPPAKSFGGSFIARFTLNEIPVEKRVEFPAGGRISIGRIGENTLAIDDASISKIHATLASNADGKISVADTGSTNGTFINDERISYGKANLLETGDVLKLGLIEVKFEFVPAAIVVEPLLDAKKDPSNTVTIDGFEFTSQISSEETENESKDEPISLPEPSE